ncbi:helicase-related protein [Glycomyces arizonensis]|uniref:helicase-related protein n=1 Tax=Glycomyces arizonensis TaxID=256035 RepID=UPI00040CB4CB|nr:helicase-related protein [Glycomyces arizonensis]
MNPRDELTEYLRRQLIGPAYGEQETIEGPPDSRYLMGTLYPQDADLHTQLDRAAEVLDGLGAEPGQDDVDPATDPLPESNVWLPSSIGISFYTDAEDLEVRCGAARYRIEKGRSRRWHRESLPEETYKIGPGTSLLDVLGQRGELRIVRRPCGSGELITVSLVNSAITADGKDHWDDMLFQVTLDVDIIEGRLLEYPSARLVSTDPEEHELRLQYRHVRTYAVGNGCAVEERPNALGSVTGLSATFMPQADVPAVRAAGAESPVLDIAHLADPAVPLTQLRAELEGFAAFYRDWYRWQRKADIPPWGKEAAGRILDRIGRAVDRIESGVRTLCDPSRPEVLRAFRLANRAMALQMRHSRDDLGGSLRDRTEPVELEPEIDGDAAWYPFQLAFVLLALDGTVDPGHPDRGVTDLIWFPTGGGKTEAYLLLAAFTMLLRRGRPDGGGTAVLSRYTLSLLTTQQFQRTAATVCALEALRRDDPAVLGDDEFSLGLWVGEQTTPNTYEHAREAFHGERNAVQPEGRFILDRCPWCGTRIMPAYRSDDDRDYGVRAGADSCEFFCPRTECRFHDRLPIAVVDQDLYREPPTFLLGTVDKFARLAWEHEAGKLFGAGTGNAPPSLVIQDELHLLTGPLGTTVGLYEAAVMGLCSSGGTPPKVVASTATIRRAGDQVRSLYGSDVQLFPPAGLDARDSYFAVEDTDTKAQGHKPGRRYLGVMAPGHTAGRATVAIAAAMLQGAAELPTAHRDDYWTLVGYHQSLRELGRTVTAASDEIPAELRGLAEHGAGRELHESAVEELSSRRDRYEQPGILDRLSKPWDDPRAVSFLPCTNMLSVGVDVGRLALMLMLGQPKTTSEYIQATSRVGRDRVPGLVLTFLNATRPRDRSHYESFGVYHRSLYRQVEPTSLTPWSVPSRLRALHAALVTLVRHRLGMTEDEQAGEIIERMDEAKLLAAEIAGWAAQSSPDDAAAVRTHLDDLLAAWAAEAHRAREEGRKLYYHSKTKQHRRLLKDFEQPLGLWETPHSMRNVDRECRVDVMEGFWK